MPKDEMKMLAEAGAAQLADHYLKINTENSKRLLDEGKGVKVLSVYNRKIMQDACNKFISIAALASAADPQSKELVRWLNKLIQELSEPKERYYPPLAQAYYTKTIQYMNHAIQSSGSIKERSFLAFMLQGLTKIGFADDKLFVSNLFRQDELDE